LAIQSVKTGTLCTATTTGRHSVKVPQLGTVTVFYIDITGGTASVDVEVSDDNSTFFIVREAVTAKTVHRIAMPSSVVAVNITSISGATVTVKYRQVVYDSPPDAIIESFEAGDVRARKFIIDGDVSVNLASSFGVATRFYGPAQPGTSNGTLYTVAASKIAVIKALHIANVTASAATITLSISGSTDATMWLKEFSVPANSTYDWTGELALAAADTIQGLQGTSAALTVVISGDLRDV
jgi:hypothetical protein